MSFSTLLMPLGLYQPFVDGIGNLDFSVLIPGGIGVLLTIILLSNIVNTLFKNHFSVSFHAIIGIVIMATVMIIPFGSFTVSPANFIVNIVCIVVGIVVATILDKFNTKILNNKE
jgi:putative membrane protein